MERTTARKRPSKLAKRLGIAAAAAVIGGFGIAASLPANADEIPGHDSWGYSKISYDDARDQAIAQCGPLYGDNGGTLMDNYFDDAQKLYVVRINCGKF